MENLANNYTHIKGRGIDVDLENDPTYPMKKWNGDDHKRMNYERPPLQPVNIEVLHSNERPNITAVFGTSAPPSGLSGKIRRYAFQYSESSYWHWLPLVVADRVNAVEGIIDDLKRGHIPNLFAEWGWKAAWKHNPQGVIKKVAVGLAVGAALVTWISRKSKD